MITVYFIQVKALEFMENYDLSRELYKKTKAVAVKAMGNGYLLLAFKSSEKRAIAYLEWQKYFKTTAIAGSGEAEEEWLGKEGVLNSK